MKVKRNTPTYTIKLTQEDLRQLLQIVGMAYDHKDLSPNSGAMSLQDISDIYDTIHEAFKE